MLRLLFNVLDDILDSTVIFGYDRIGYSVRKSIWDANALNVNMRGKVCVVTGANSGLGKATCLGLAERGATVVMVCRNREKGILAQKEIMESSNNPEIFLEIVDLSLQSSIQKFAEVFIKKYYHLDVLVNNAGVLSDTRQVTKEGIELTFATNTLAYFSMIYHLQTLLKTTTNSRVINVTSGGMYFYPLDTQDFQFEKSQFNGIKAYAITKRAEVILTELWADKLKNFGVTVNCMHPGWADTPSVQNALPKFYSLTKPILRTPQEGADTIVWLAVKKDWVPRDTGKLYFDRKVRTMHRFFTTLNSTAEKQAFWKYCASLAKVAL
jgi:dehydrogenase/reductase SDR family member 12